MNNRLTQSTSTSATANPASQLPSLSRQALPGLYRSASNASANGQATYFLGLRLYLILLITAALVSFALPESSIGAALSAALFVITLLILILLKINRPDDIWYNGRAVAESVKTRTWRWVMRAEPYTDPQASTVEKAFIDDLAEMLRENQSLSEHLSVSEGIQQPISERMRQVRNLSVGDRLALYKEQRVSDQANWYFKKARSNKRLANRWFWASVVLHVAAIAMLLIRIPNTAIELPIEVISTAAGAVLTWLEAKKHKELTSSYALAAHEIGLILGQMNSIRTEAELADFVLNSENAFSREHTQWIARKSG